MVVSGDKDLTQLVNDRVLVWDAMRDIRYDSKKVEEKFGVGPDKIRDYLSITGDSSDNIPGVPGVGAKTATKLLTEFDSLDEILENISKVPEIKGLRGAKGVAAKIENNLESLEMSRRLVTLKEDVEPFNSYSDLSEFERLAPIEEKWRPLFEELEFSWALRTLSTLPVNGNASSCLLYTSPSPRDATLSRMPSSA